MRRGWPKLLAVCGLCVLLVVGMACRRRSDPEPVPGSEATASLAEPAAGAPATVVMNLYFPGDERLFAEIREVPVHTERLEQARAIVEALLAGPRGEGLVPPLPQATTLGGIYELSLGELIVNLSCPTGPPASSGSLREVLSAYSLVNSLVLNLDGVERVVILWNDRQQTAFAGHLDTTRPLPADTRLIARAP